MPVFTGSCSAAASWQVWGLLAAGHLHGTRAWGSQTARWCVLARPLRKYNMLGVVVLHHPPGPCPEVPGLCSGHRTEAAGPAAAGPAATSARVMQQL